MARWCTSCAMVNRSRRWYRPIVVTAGAAAVEALEEAEDIRSARVLRTVATLADDPRPLGATRLVGADDLWRIRVGDYRVVYAIEDDQLVVIVVRVAGRGKVYRDI
ncbi:MAG: type II toxin-antitoxin system RelE family toxin [Pseudonocardiaceae bacterium]